MQKSPLIPQKFVSPSYLSGLPDDTPVLVGFSGGADSSALLRMLCEYREMTGAPIYAAHINHGIRGAEADRDQAFCQQVADSLGVRLFVLNADVPLIANERKMSIETAAREVRYEFFEKIMAENSIPLLATAHNANDNFETMLFNKTDTQAHKTRNTGVLRKERHRLRYRQHQHRYRLHKKQNPKSDNPSA